MNEGHYSLRCVEQKRAWFAWFFPQKVSAFGDFRIKLFLLITLSRTTFYIYKIENDK